MKKCKKVQFRTEADALFYIEKLKKTSVQEKKPVATYLCNICLTWHLTSRTEKDLSEIKKLKEIIKLKYVLITSLNQRINKFRKND